MKIKNGFLIEVAHKALDHLIRYPTPSELTYAWSFGSLAGLCLVVQIVTGVFLTMHYNPSVTDAFNSVEHIMRDVNYGWLFRYTHANGASMFFIVTYLHMARGLFYSSYTSPRGELWISGVILFLLIMATAFLGYVLPWGQMSFWGATVITNFFSAIPAVGNSIVLWLWGGFSVGNPTLTRFFALHYLLPMIVALFSIIHLFILHSTDVGSSIPLGVKSKEFIDFSANLWLKDFVAWAVFALLFVYFVFFNPNVLGHSDNYIPANPMVTPPHIVPEWYFLPFYAILRSIPDKLGGVIAMFGAIIVLALLPLFTYTSRQEGLLKIRSTHFRYPYVIFFFLFFVSFVILMVVGGKPVVSPYIEYGQIATIYYFVFLLGIIPLFGYLEGLRK